MDALREILAKRKKGMNYAGIPSFCTASDLVIEACLKQAVRFDDYVLVEATANQVNQFGGYTGMKPADYRDFVYKIADGIGFPKEKIILGGDHLGPLTWQDEPEAEAMAKSIELVKLFVLAGFKKIHLDTSMRVADDPTDQMLSDETIARRGAILYEACEEAYQELLKSNPDEARPAFIIGSEVPIPGGAQEAEDSISVTKPEAVEKTLAVYKEQFEKRGLNDAFDNIIGIVVQPGVEFGDEDVFHYDRTNAAELTRVMKKHDNVVLEGHSTDYQPPKCLKEMVEDGIAILKVGPALTFSLREGLFALSMMEKILVPESEQAHFIEVMEETMMKDPANWKKHYHGSEEELAIKRKYSFSDRCRYYFAQPEMKNAIAKLFDNMSKVHIPLGMLRQYMPQQYIKVRDGVLPADPKELAEDCVVHLVEDYNYATKINYMISDAFYC
ncbi:MAG: class II D-tagatose-bisphosphate aldolase, non-catalytic subunit [Lachnospiraceae bacterium]|nr:class II D-tagatose-bisphosphate aldolase, non-catalytic subunit [Lachnospiraceae bacterium]MBR4575255.1 class II D-tagatose-bisphosphate aldolase, non-catalytic subunit [Lachnospiraceae bacterium]